MKRFALGFFPALIAFAIAVFISMLLRSGEVNKPDNGYRIGFPFVFLVSGENGTTADSFSPTRLAADVAIGLGAATVCGFCVVWKKRRPSPDKKTQTATTTTVIDFWTKS